ncbi:beta-ketoacyl-[acyl-carrier-protein] synthase family protein [Streptomyces sp. H27-D2]|uniref:beta-ketoacyl-[acyl-carrier-protein] synthase family protein n=1 Tax=Streptomyces sp. H27-D2 TaxID=3046304 RepID=UPI002DB60FA8|nr:beta-ketoacyl-[acyl-carrier-protein] synthase family protein [Streptomyces sp. H27-D2]MEC4019140.1 beta-ketoacyl-[acyl-carrier-protein] synthase family protein [Streptomyces sp. H27-D2]
MDVSSGSSGPNSREEPVVITGIGVMLPGASNVNEFWQDVRAGNSRLGFLTRCDPGRIPVSVAGQLKGFDHQKYLPDLPDAHARRYSRDALVVMSAIEEARRDASLDGSEIDPRRLSLIASSSRGPLEWVSNALEDPANDSENFGNSGAMLRGLPGCAATMSAIHSNIQGLVTTLSSACVGGQHAIGFATELLRSGAADAVVVAGYEFPLLSVIYKSFASMGKGVLSSESEDPANAVRPYTRDREGFVFGEGAVALCLERESFARDRGAAGYARVLSHRALNEAGHPFGMDMTGSVTAGVVVDALAAAGRGPQDVDYYMGHGTGTPKNDVAESRMLGVLYEGRPRSGWPPLSSVKPVYGHLLGAAGLVNTAATALSLHHQCLCATANYAGAAPDPECDHDHVGEGARPAELDLAVSLSFAIGSQTSALVLGSA